MISTSPHSDSNLGKFPPSTSYLMSVNISDHTGQTWVQTFNEQAETLLEKSADEMVAIKDSDHKEFEAVFQRALFKSFMVKLRVKADTFQVRGDNLFAGLYVHGSMMRGVLTSCSFLGF